MSTTTLTKESLAARLHGREYGREIASGEEAEIKAARLVAVFGYSDDNAELRGAIHDEVGCYNGGEFWLDVKGVKTATEEEVEVLEKFGFLTQLMAKTKKVEAQWDKEGYSWTYKTDIPHATFDIMEDGEKFCRGIVFSISDLT